MLWLRKYEGKQVADVASESSSKLIIHCQERVVARFRGPQKKKTELEKQLNNKRAGLAGEERLLDTIHSAGLPQGSKVLWDIGLPMPFGAFIQLDTILIMPSGVFIFEAKQIGGRLRFTQGPAELQKVENGLVTQSMDCPVAQFRDQQESLGNWLRMQQLNVPVGGAVVLTANPIVEQIQAGLPVIRLRELRSLIRLHAGKPAIWTADEILEIAGRIGKSNTPYLPFPYCDFAQIDRRDLYWGPICICTGWLDKASERIWTCPLCGLEKEAPYRETILDWLLLRSRTITTRQCRDLFYLSSSSSPQRILSEFPLRKVGKGRSVRHVLDYPQALRFLHNMQQLVLSTR